MRAVRAKDIRVKAYLSLGPKEKGRTRQVYRAAKRLYYEARREQGRR